MRRTTFMHLCSILQPSLTHCNSRFRRSLQVELRVAICLWRLATNLEFRSIGHLFGVGRSTACMITQEVVAAINKIMRPLYIKTPSPAELKKIVQGFKDKWRFPQVAGAIDGTHICITAPPDYSADYYNRKGFYSVILQAVVDNKLKFWDINIGWPGRVHDARVFVNSSLYQRGQDGTLFPAWTERFENVDVPLFILGDAAYPLLPWLIKAYTENTGMTAQQSNFNHRLSQARMTVERAFGRLKARWRCLLKRCDAHINHISHIISACCVLHNFCEIHNEEVMPLEETESAFQEDNEDHQFCRDSQGGHDIRDALCTYMSRL
ncbi:uncharacterized protein [Pseudorasbora parva]|uniref:uncharacterized protein n=1 Tax=Pseudorasbora parva TaxID=51549 RepID=UPI00351F32EB